jgi:predicted DNA-binding transcriptional regulator AlpA
MEVKADKLVELLRTSGAAAMTGLSASTLNKLRCAGGGPPFLKLGRAVRYNPDDLKEWLDSRRVRSTSEIVVQSAGQSIGFESVKHGQAV